MAPVVAHVVEIEGLRPTFIDAAGIEVDGGSFEWARPQMPVTGALALRLWDLIGSRSSPGRRTGLYSQSVFGRLLLGRQ